MLIPLLSEADPRVSAEGYWPHMHVDKAGTCLVSQPATHCRPLTWQRIAELKLPPDSRRPECLGEFTFNQYGLMICSKNNWNVFEPMFDTMRELANADFGEVIELRNIVLHFRRGITPKDTDRLRRFRDRLRYDRELYARELGTGVS